MGWIKGCSSHLVGKKINIVKGLRELSDQTTHQTTHYNQAIDEKVIFRLQSDKDMQATQ